MPPNSDGLGSAGWSYRAGRRVWRGREGDQEGDAYGGLWYNCAVGAAVEKRRANGMACQVARIGPLRNKAGVSRSPSIGTTDERGQTRISFSDSSVSICVYLWFLLSFPFFFAVPDG